MQNQLQVNRLKFRFEANSIVVSLYAGDTSLILPEFPFGMVSNIGSHFLVAYSACMDVQSVLEAVNKH